MDSHNQSNLRSHDQRGVPRSDQPAKAGAHDDQQSVDHLAVSRLTPIFHKLLSLTYAQTLTSLSKPYAMDASTADIVSLRALRVLKHVTRIAIEMHNSNRKQDSIHGEIATCRLSMDTPLLPKLIVPFYSLHLAVSYSRRTEEVIGFSTCTGRQELQQLRLTIATIGVGRR